MLLLLSIVLGMILFFGLLLFVPMSLGIDFLREGESQKVRIRARIFGIPFSFSVPLDRQKKKNAREEKKNASLTPKNFIKFAKDLYHGYCEAEHEFKDLLREIKEKVGCNEIYFSIHYGTKNPALTGMLNPAIWTAGTLLLKVIESLIGVQKKTLNVYPDFKEVHMCLHIKSSFQFRLYHAIRFTFDFIRLVNIIKSYITTENNEKEGVNNGRTSD